MYARIVLKHGMLVHTGVRGWRRGQGLKESDKTACSVAPPQWLDEEVEEEKEEKKRRRRKRRGGGGGGGRREAEEEEDEEEEREG